MHVKFASRRRQRAECNYQNCARNLCFPSTAFFDDVAKQAEHNLKIVRNKDQRGKKKPKRSTQGAWTDVGSSIPSSGRVAAKQMHVDPPDHSTQRLGAVLQTCFGHTSAAITVSEFEPVSDSAAPK